MRLLVQLLATKFSMQMSDCIDELSPQARRNPSFSANELTAHKTGLLHELRLQLKDSWHALIIHLIRNKLGGPIPSCSLDYPILQTCQPHDAQTSNSQALLSFLFIPLCELQ